MSRRNWFHVIVFTVQLGLFGSSVAEPHDRAGIDSGQAALQALGNGVNLGTVLETDTIDRIFDCPGGLTRYRLDDEGRLLPVAAIADDRAALDRLEGISGPAADDRLPFYETNRSLGARHVRLPVAWHRYLCGDSGIGTTLDAAALSTLRISPGLVETVHRVARAAAAVDMKLIVNQHNFKVFGMAHTPEHRALFLKLWHQIGSALGDLDEQDVYFEILNEPPAGDFCNRHWSRMIVDAVEAIRTSGVGSSRPDRNRNRPLLIGACNPNDYQHIAALAEPLWILRTVASGMNPLIVTWHYYDPSRATHWQRSADKHEPCRCGGDCVPPNHPVLLDCASACPTSDRASEPGADAFEPGDPQTGKPARWQMNNKKRFEQAIYSAAQLRVALHLGEIGFERYLRSILDRPGTPLESLGCPDTPLLQAEQADMKRERLRAMLQVDRERWFKDVLALARAAKMPVTAFNAFQSFGLFEAGRPSDPEILGTLFGK